MIQRLPLLILLFISGSFGLCAQDFERDTAIANDQFMEGNILMRQRKFEEAAPPLRQAYELYKKHELNNAVLSVSTKLIKTLQGDDAHAASVDVALEAVDLCKQVLGKKDTMYLPQLYNYISVGYTRQGMYRMAIKANNKALEVGQQKVDNYRILKRAYEGLGVNYYFLGDYQQAIKYYQQQEQLIVAAYGEEYFDLVALYSKKAAVVYKMGKFEQALDYMLDAKDIIEGKDSPQARRLLGSTYNNIAATYITLNQPNRAFEYLDKAEVMYKKTQGEESPAIINVYANKGNILASKNLYKEAIPFFQRAILLVEKLSNKRQQHQQVQLYLALSQTLSSMSRYEEATDYINKAISYYIKNDMGMHVNLTEAYHQLAEIALKQEDYVTFFDKEKQALDILYTNFPKGKHPKISGRYLSIAKGYAAQNDFEEAMSYLDKSLQAITSSEEKNIDSIVINKEYLSARDLLVCLNGSISINRKWYLQSKAITHLEKAYQTLKVVQLLLEKMQQTMQVGDKKQLLKDYHTINSFAIETAWLYYEITEEPAYLEEALTFAERNKSAILMDVLRDDAAMKFGNLPDSLVMQETQLTKMVATLEKKVLDAQTGAINESAVNLKGQLLETREQLYQLHQKIKADYPKYASLKYEKNEIAVASIQEDLLEDGSALLEYYVTDTVIFLFAITPKEYQVYKMPLEKATLDSLVSQLRQSLSDYDYIIANEKEATALYTSAAYALYQKLIAPAKTQLKDSKQLVIVADNLLGYIPFEVLLTQPYEQETEKVDYKTLPYLLQDYPISYSYSAAWLLENSKRAGTTNNANVLALGASYPKEYVPLSFRSRRENELREHLHALPAVSKEIEELEANFVGTFLTDSMATEAQFKAHAANHGILHLAMHGVLDVSHPIASCLAMTENGDTLEDNLLHAYEISQMDLNASMVVLSACETGYGKFEQGEGVMSLARSFMYAGVPSLLVSLWQVNDASTSVIIKEFYKNLSKGQSKEVALTNAKLYYLEHAKGIAAHPAFWAPFVHIGDTVPIAVNTGGFAWWKWLVGGLLIAVIAWLWWRAIQC